MKFGLLEAHQQVFVLRSYKGHTLKSNFSAREADRNTVEDKVLWRFAAMKDGGTEIRKGLPDEHTVVCKLILL